jgi:hypothetical protein
VRGFLVRFFVTLTGTQIGITIQFLVTANACIRRVVRNNEPVGAEGLASVATEDVALHKDLIV